MTKLETPEETTLAIGAKFALCEFVLRMLIERHPNEAEIKSKIEQIMPILEVPLNGNAADLKVIRDAKARILNQEAG